MESTYVADWDVAQEVTPEADREPIRRTTEEPERAPEGDVYAVVKTILGYDPDRIATGERSTTDAILRDPVWRARVRRSLKQAREGKTRSADEYWAESDAESDEE